MVMKNPKLLGPLTQKLLKSLGGFMGSTVTKLYNKYGAGPVKVLKKGWNGMAKGFKWIGGNFKSGFSVCIYLFLFIYLLISADKLCYIR